MEDKQVFWLKLTLIIGVLMVAVATIVLVALPQIPEFTTQNGTVILTLLYVLYDKLNGVEKHLKDKETNKSIKDESK